MANQELTDLTLLASLTNSDLFFVRDVSANIDKQITVASMATLFGGGNFLSHTDTPSVYTGAQSNFVKVNALGTALEFVADPGFLTDITAEVLDDLSDVTITSVATGEILAFTGSEWENQTLTELGIAPSTHTHVEADITDLQAYALAVHTHVEADITDLQNYALAVHTHVEADITDLQAYLLDITGEAFTDLSDTPAAYAAAGTFFVRVNAGATALEFVADPGYTVAGHTHVEADITDLGNYSVVGHTHVEADITDLQAYVLPTDSIDILADVDTTTATPAPGDMLAWNGTNWVPASGMAPGAHASTHVSLGSDEIDGDVLDIDFIPANYTRSTAPTEVTTVVELTAHLAGIDAEILTINNNFTGHTHVEADITDLQSYALVSHTHVEADITDLQSYLLNITNENLGDLSDVVLTSEVDGELLRYNGTNWINNTLAEAGVAPASHTHVEADITDLQSYLLNINAESIDDLSDVDTTTVAPSVGEHLEWDGSNWVPGTAGGGSSTFIALTDTPAVYTAAGTFFVRVNAGATALEFVADPGYTVAGHTHVEADITDLQAYVLPTDSIDILADVDTTTATPTTGDHLEWNGTTWVPLPAAAATSFIGLSDTPNNYNSGAGKFVKVNSGETGLEYFADPGFIVDINSLSIGELSDVDTTGPNAPATGEHLGWNGTIWIPVATVTAINELSDVDTTGPNAPSTGDHLEWNGSTWVPSTATAATAFLGLTDTPADYTAAGTFFVRVNAGATALEFVADPGYTVAGHTHVEADITDLQAYLLNINSESIDELSDVTITSVASGELLTFTGTVWENQTLVEAGVAPASHTHVEADITDLQNYSLVGHTHVEADITDLQAYLLDITGEAFTDLSDTPANYTAAGTFFVRVNAGATALEFVADPGYTVAGHTYVEADITDLQAYLLNINSESIDDLSDVVVAAVAAGEILKFDGGNWINNTLAEAGVAAVSHTHVEADITDLQSYLLNINAESIDDLSDVDTTTAAPSASDVLAWDGSNWIPSSPTAPGAHASTHVRGSTDVIDADVLDITFVPSNYTRLTSPSEVTNVLELTAHLAGIDAELLTFSTISHAATHIAGGSDEVDGDRVDIDFSPVNYTPDATPSEVTLTNELTAHLAGIDNTLLAVQSFPKWDRQMSSDTSLIQTTSTTFIDIPGLVVTTRDLGNGQNGSYLIHFSASVSHASQKSSIEFQLEVDGVVVTESITTINFKDASLFLDTQFSWYEDPIINGKIIKVLWRQTQTTGSDSNRTATMTDRRLIISGVPSDAVVV